jgi:hypothetical protein
MPRTEDAAAENDSSNATLCGDCSKMLQKPFVCARCQTRQQILGGEGREGAGRGARCGGKGACG